MKAAVLSTKHRFMALIIMLLLSAICLVVVYAQTREVKQVDSVATSAPSEQLVVQPAIVEIPTSAKYDKQAIQAVVDNATTNGTYSVVVRHADSGDVLATHQPNRTSFTASLYKFYIAFLGWQDIDSGDLELVEDFQGGSSTLECMDLMIRESDSPCGEKLLANYDYALATDRLRVLGLPDVSVTAFKTSAADMAALLQLVYDREVLQDSSTDQLLDSLQAQIYVKGLRTGFADKIVYDKVGFSSIDWHDVGLVELDSGDTIIVSILSEGVGSTGVRGLASALNDYFDTL